MHTQRHLGYYHHRRKAHFDDANTIQSVNFRLGDAVPRHILETARETYLHTRDPLLREQIHTKLESFADKGHGSAVLRENEHARIMIDELQQFNGERYELLAWCIMPNHVHVCFQQYDGHRLASILQSWKGRSSRKINLSLGKKGPLWEPDYWDRSLRNAHQLRREIEYIHFNPVSAKLCRGPEEWPFSSALDRPSRAATAALLM